MRFETGIWQAAWNVLCRNWKTAAGAIVAAMTLDLVSEYLGKAGSSSGFVPDLIIWSMVAISAHGTVLLDKPDFAFNKSQKIFWPFVWRSGVLILLSAIPFIVAFIIFDGGERSFNLNLLKALPVLGLAALLVFAVLGTWLPAVVVEGDKQLGAAFGRAGRSFSYAALRLLIGPGLLQAILLALIMVVAGQGILSGEVFGAAGFSFSDLISLPVIYAVRTFTVTLLAVILSRSYLIAEDARSAPPA